MFLRKVDNKKESGFKKFKKMVQLKELDAIRDALQAWAARCKSSKEDTAVPAWTDAETGWQSFKFSLETVIQGMALKTAWSLFTDTKKEYALMYDTASEENDAFVLRYRKTGTTTYSREHIYPRQALFLTLYGSKIVQAATTNSRVKTIAEETRISFLPQMYVSWCAAFEQDVRLKLKTRYAELFTSKKPFSMEASD